MRVYGKIDKWILIYIDDSLGNKEETDNIYHIIERSRKNEKFW
jgi:hypothetical protein